MGPQKDAHVRTASSTYAYDKDNRLTKATEGTISANYTYDSFSRMTGLTAKNGSTSYHKNASYIRRV